MIMVPDGSRVEVVWVTVNIGLILWTLNKRLSSFIVGTKEELRISVVLVISLSTMQVNHLRGATRVESWVAAVTASRACFAFKGVSPVQRCVDDWRGAEIGKRIIGSREDVRARLEIVHPRDLVRNRLLDLERFA